MPVTGPYIDPSAVEYTANLGIAGHAADHSEMVAALAAKADISGGFLARSQREGATIHSVAGVPSSSLGQDGDYAIDSTAGALYGPKAVGAWPTPWYFGTSEVSVGGGLPGEVIPAMSEGIWKDTGRTLANGTAYLLRWRPQVARASVNVAFEVTVAASANDPVDVGVYTSSADGQTLTRVASSGATTGKLNSTGVKRVSLAFNFQPSVTYVLAISASITGTTPTIVGRAVQSAETIQLYGTTFPRALAGSKSASHPLPATIAAPATPGSLTTVPMLAVLEV